ncbi:MAG TPA: hypothetical protein VLA97_10295 [Nocardioidaceae bacterium]|nr:hypothetical protein [Nocardioidaceae bacterium]
MLHDLAAWLLHSPRRLLTVTAVVVLTGVLAVGSLDRPDRGEAVTASRPASDAPAVGENLLSERVTDPEAHVPVRAIRAVATRFLDGYVVPPDRRTRSVPAGLSNTTTPALWRGLRLTDPSALPRATVRELTIDAAGAYSGEVLAELSDDSILRLSVVAWERGWRVSDVRPEDS